VPGGEVAGTVCEVGSDVRSIKVGDRVSDPTFLDAASRLNSARDSKVRLKITNVYAM
jgi:D-arabinose 1-dehydrogenase-like Zn-dependent alcohol dehydrogenase